MIIYLVRHGKTQCNINGTYNGIVDEPVCEVGLSELNTHKEIYKDMTFDYIYSSPLIRCQQTFATLFPHLEINEFKDDLKEMNFGDWYGVNIMDNVNRLLKEGYTMEDYVDPPNGEKHDELFSRTSKSIDDIINKHNDDEKILVVAHGLVIGSIIKQIYGDDTHLYRLTPENGLGYIIDTNNESITKISSSNKE